MTERGQQLQKQFEAKEYVTHMGPEKFTDYDFADMEQAEVDLMLNALADMSEYREPVMYFNMLEDLVASLEALEAHLR